MACVLAQFLFACSTTARNKLPPLRTVKDVDLDRYLGKWYEIAAIPASFQHNCVASTATYTKRPDGRINVLNQCRNKTLDGKLRSAQATAWVAGDGSDKGKLKVRFVWPFTGDYWIIEVARDYQWVLVGHPSRDYLWILSRRPTMEAGLYEQLLARAAAQGCDTARLRKTLQVANQ